MFCQQAVAESGDGRLQSLLPSGLQGKIAFRVKTHGTIVLVGRTYADQLIVDDQDLGMHIKALVAQVG